MYAVPVTIYDAGDGRAALTGETVLLVRGAVISDEQAAELGLRELIEGSTSSPQAAPEPAEGPPPELVVEPAPLPSFPNFQGDN